MESRRLRVPPVATSSWTAALVLARDVRYAGLRGRDRTCGLAHARGCRRDPTPRRARAHHGTRTLGRALPAARLGTQRLRDVVEAPPRRADRLRATDVVERREGSSPLLPEPQDDDRSRARDPRNDGLSGDARISGRVAPGTS